MVLVVVGLFGVGLGWGDGVLGGGACGSHPGWYRDEAFAKHAAGVYIYSERAGGSAGKR